MKTVNIESVIKSLSEALNESEQIVKDELLALIKQIAELPEGRDVRLSKMGIFKRRDGKLIYQPDHILEMEINYEFSGQQPIVLAEGTGSFFPVEKTEHDTSKTKGRDEFINVDSPKQKEESSSDYDALLDEFERDFKPFEEDNTKKDDKEDRFSDDEINVIPDEKPVGSRFGFTDEHDWDDETERDETKEQELTDSQDSSHKAKSSEKEKSEVSDEEQAKEKKAEHKEDVEKIEIKTPPPLKPEDVLEVGDVIPSDKLRGVDADSEFGDDEDDKASDELAVEFTTLLKKMREKAQKASQEPTPVDDDEEASEEPASKTPTAASSSTSKIVDKEKYQPEIASTEKGTKKLDSDQDKNVKETETDVTGDNKKESKPDKPVSRKRTYPESDRPYQPESSGKDWFDKAGKDTGKQEQGERMEWKQKNEDDNNALPSIKTVKPDSGERGKKPKQQSDKSSRKIDTSTVGIVIVLVLMLLILLFGAYYMGYFGDISGDDPVVENPTAVEDPLDYPDADEPIVANPEDETPSDELDPEVTPPSETETPSEGETPDEAEQPSEDFEYGISGDFDTSVTDFFGIIIASVSDESAAERQKSQLDSLGYRTHTYSLLLPNGRTTWRVVVGQFENAEDARVNALNMPTPYRNNYFVTNVKL